MSDRNIVLLPQKNHVYLYMAGLAILVLNRLKHGLQGYTTPRTFPISEIERAIEYDFSIVKLWNDYLKIYTGTDNCFENKSILELGPGDNLGIGLITLMHGAEKYNAIDINNLIENVPKEFYEKLFQVMESKTGNKTDINDLREQLKKTAERQNDKLNYIIDLSFDLYRFKDNGINLVISNAAVEHFSNVEKTIRQLSDIANPGCVMAMSIDLKTHSRWIREVDPLNIYRYNSFIYNFLKFSGSPNRVRPYEYTNLLEKCGWGRIEVFDIVSVDANYAGSIQKHLNRNFRSSENEIERLYIMICATKN